MPPGSSSDFGPVRRWLFRPLWRMPAGWVTPYVLIVMTLFFGVLPLLSWWLT